MMTSVKLQHTFNLHQQEPILHNTNPSSHKNLSSKTRLNACACECVILLLHIFCLIREQQCALLLRILNLLETNGIRIENYSEEGIAVV